MNADSLNIAIDNLRAKDKLEETKAVLRVISHKMVIPLYLLFWIADLIYVPHLKWEFLVVRLTLIPVSIAVLYYTNRIKDFNQMQWLAVVYIAYLALGIQYMLFRIEIPDSPYYAGLNLVALGTLSFIPWERRVFLAVTSIIFLPLVAIAIYHSSSVYELRGFAINCFFVVSTIVILFLIRFFNERLRLKELLTRSRLHNEIELRNEIIKEKTKEAVQLKELSRQFSPQIVDAIRSGKVELKSGIHRSELCTIFVDIVNSTERINRIDKDDFQKVMSKFMDDTMKVLLKYDITIDKFLGDGILSFSNDPVKYPDYAIRSVRAAVEIQDRIQKNQDFYEEYWLAPFEVRIGIAKGYASVGFYGSTRYFHSYTALGPVVNLACRVCDAAQAGEVLITNKVRGALGEVDGIIFTDKGKHNLKGFEADSLKLYSVGLEDSVSISSGSLDCPECGDGVLSLETNDQGIYVLQCRSCHHICDEIIETGSKAA